MDDRADQNGPGDDLGGAFRADLLHRKALRLHAARRALIAAGVALAMLATVGALHAWRWYLGDLPKPPPKEQLASLGRAPGMTFLDRHGRIVATRGPKYGRQVSVDELPVYVPLAFLAAEDRRFRDHGGVDFQGVVRASFVNTRSGRTVEGGSTLTQQLARDLFLTGDRTFKRKLQEALLATALERRMSKDEILQLYLNRVFLGENAYGIDAAARTYFGKPAAGLTLAEAAVLAGLPKAPSVLNPNDNPKGALARGRVVLERMRREGWISRAQMREAQRQPLMLAPHQREGDFAWVIDLAAAEAKRRAGGRAEDLIVRLSVDPQMQATAQDVVRRVLDEQGKTAGATQAAMVALGPDGAIRALVGGYDHGQSPFNRAVQAKRQPGSAFKPFVWAAALEAGLGETDVRSSAPIAMGPWRPGEGSREPAGELTLTDALVRSSNTVAVRLVDEVGPDRAAALARRFGLGSIPADPERSLALGAYEVTLLELTGAYQVFQQGGRLTRPYLVEEVARSDGRVLWRRPLPDPAPVYDPARAGAMVRMMTGVVERGTGRKAAFGGAAAGKTGTTQNHRDAWFVGFTPDWAAGVWVGNDDGRPMKEVSGGDLPADIWRRFMTAAHRGLAARDFDARRAAETDGGSRQAFYATLAAEFARTAAAR